jgi:hypothetical protein
MSMRVLSSPEAIEKADVMRRVIEQGLVEQLTTLDQAAARLSDPNVWDGPHAVQFRGVWGEVAPRLEAARTDLADLRHRIDAICGDILAAGGSAR